MRANDRYVALQHATAHAEWLFEALVHHIATTEDAQPIVSDDGFPFVVDSPVSLDVIAGRYEELRAMVQLLVEVRADLRRLNRERGNR